MTRRALVLGGGGVVGIAWEAGVIAGLAERGVSLALADDVIGTSAGSVVGAWLTGGRDFAQLAAAQAEPPPAGEGSRGAASPDLAYLANVFRKWTSYERLGPEQGRELGALALEAKTPPEERSLRWFVRELAMEHWPRQLRLTAVDAQSGELRVFDAKSGVPLTSAVAASCCVPGIFAPVTIGGRRYIDGGARSGTSADLARGAKHVVVLTPMARGNAGLARLMNTLLERELEALREAGSEVEHIGLAPGDGRVLGLDFMDPKKRADAVRLGLETGRREASRPGLAAWRR
jgi:NTE family protein